MCTCQGKETSSQNQEDSLLKDEDVDKETGSISSSISLNPKSTKQMSAVVCIDVESDKDDSGFEIPHHPVPTKPNITISPVSTGFGSSKKKIQLSSLSPSTSSINLQSSSSTDMWKTATTNFESQEMQREKELKMEIHEAEKAAEEVSLHFRSASSNSTHSNFLPPFFRMLMYLIYPSAMEKVGKEKTAGD